MRFAKLQFRYLVFFLAWALARDASTTAWIAEKLARWADDGPPLFG